MALFFYANQMDCEIQFNAIRIIGFPVDMWSSLYRQMVTLPMADTHAVCLFVCRLIRSINSIQVWIFVLSLSTNYGVVYKKRPSIFAPSFRLLSVFLRNHNGFYCLDIPRCNRCIIFDSSKYKEKCILFSCEIPRSYSFVNNVILLDYVWALLWNCCYAFWTVVFGWRMYR